MSQSPTRLTREIPRIPEEPLLPTNKQIKEWSEAVGPTPAHSTALQVIKLTYTANVRDPELPMPPLVDKRILSPHVRHLARELMRTGRLNGHRTRYDSLACALKANITRIDPEEAYRIERGIKELRGKFPVLTLGSPSGREIIIKTPPLTLTWYSEQASDPDGYTDGDYEDNMEQDIGAWWIGAQKHSIGWKVKIRPVEKSPPKGFHWKITREALSYHPHVAAVGVVAQDTSIGQMLWGNLCSGDARPDITRWLVRGDFHRAFLKVIEQLQSYNAGGAYHLIEKYLAPSCPRCFSTMPDQYCPQCTKQCTTCSAMVNCNLFLLCACCGLRSNNCPNCEKGRRCYICGKFSCATCREDRECSFCKPIDLQDLGDIHAISSEETQSASEPVSVEPPNVLGTQREEVGSVGDGAGTSYVAG